ncbi:MAG: hypothetical protein ABL888_22690, partial [Pirellulaceae bacterium]
KCSGSSVLLPNPPTDFLRPSSKNPKKTTKTQSKRKKIPNRRRVVNAIMPVLFSFGHSNRSWN